MAKFFHLLDPLLEHIRHAINLGQTRAAFQAHNRIRCKQARIRGCGNPPGGGEAFAIQSIAIEQDRRSRSRPQHGRRTLYGGSCGQRGSMQRGKCCHNSAFAPRGVGRHNQRRDLPRRGTRSNDRIGSVPAQIGDRSTRSQPRRTRPRDSFNIGSERRIELKMVARMLADDVNDRHMRSPRIMQIRQSIAETGTQMQQRACRFFRHTCVAIRRPGDHTFEQSEHTAHFRRPVQRRHNVDLRSSRIAEAGINPSTQQRANQTFRSVHLYREILSSSIFLAVGLQNHKPWIRAERIDYARNPQWHSVKVLKKLSSPKTPGAH